MITKATAAIAIATLMTMRTVISFQINLGKVFELSRIATQGANKANVSGYVTSYKIDYSLYGDAWYTYQDNGNSSDKVIDH